MILITSLNKILLSQYGERMIYEFEESSDETVRLIVVYEGEHIPTVNLSHVKFIKFKSTGHDTFIKKFGKLEEAKGLRIKINHNGKVDLSLDYKFDALRFSFKIFSLLQVMDEIENLEEFAWIDADIRCLKKLTHLELIKFLPENDQLMSYLGRDLHPTGSPYSECGFLGFNFRHPSLHDFLNRMSTIYVDGEIFSYEQWHDSWLWDQIRIEFENKGVKFKNISGKASKTEHPFINSELGEYFDHLKGPIRKNIGKSFQEDYKFFNK